MVVPAFGIRRLRSELLLRDVDKLLAMRKELLNLWKDAAGFIRKVFHDHNPIWLDGCSQIGQDHGDN